MKFKIRYSDQIVGILTIFAIVILIFVIFLLGSKQRWFAKDYHFHSNFETAAGINVGMAIQYKGFTIGKIKSISLEENNTVNVRFYVYDTYYNRAKEGSLIELIINPIGLSNQFLFHPGNGESLIEEGSFIPRTDTPEALALIDAGLVSIPKRDDTISNLIAQVNPLLTNINETLTQVNGAFRGSGKGPLAETMTGVATTLTNVSTMTESVNGSLPAILADVQRITANMEALTEALKDPSGLIPTLLDPEGTMFASIGNSLEAVEGTLVNVEDSTSMMKTQVPQIARLIEDLRIALVKGQDVLEALRNNPILRGGVSEKVQSDSSGTNSRNIEF